MRCWVTKGNAFSERREVSWSTDIILLLWSPLLRLVYAEGLFARSGVTPLKLFDPLEAVRIEAELFIVAGRIELGIASPAEGVSFDR